MNNFKHNLQNPSSDESDGNPSIYEKGLKETDFNVCNRHLPNRVVREQAFILVPKFG